MAIIETIPNDNEVVLTMVEDVVGAVAISQLVRYVENMVTLLLSVIIGSIRSS